MVLTLRTLLTLAVVALTGAIATILFVNETRDPFLLGGIQVNEPDHEAWFDALEQFGMNTVATTVYAKQGDWDTPHLWWEEDEEAVLHEIQGAKAHDLHVVLIPRVALDHAFERNKFLWHGMIMPPTDEGIDAWFALYREYVLKWATIAEDEGVDVFAVGSELSSLTSTVSVGRLPLLEAWYLDDEQQDERKQVVLGLGERIARHYLETRGDYGFDTLADYLDAEIHTYREWGRSMTWGEADAAVERINTRRARLEAHWRRLISEVRAVYGGRLTYAANFDQYQDVAFWDDLDLIGINAYFQLRDLSDPVSSADDLDRALLEGWREILGSLESFRRERGLVDNEVLFTEIGYTQRANSTVEPWNGFGFSLVYGDDGEELFVWGDEPPDLPERARALRALHAGHAGLERPLLRGMLYWKLSTIPAHREIEPFVVVLDAEESDPAAVEMRRFIR